MSANGWATSCSKGNSPWTWKSSSTGHQTCVRNNRWSTGLKEHSFCCPLFAISNTIIYATYFWKAWRCNCESDHRFTWSHSGVKELGQLELCAQYYLHSGLFIKATMQFHSNPMPWQSKQAWCTMSPVELMLNIQSIRQHEQRIENPNT